MPPLRHGRGYWHQSANICRLSVLFADVKGLQLGHARRNVEAMYSSKLIFSTAVAVAAHFFLRFDFSLDNNYVSCLFVSGPQLKNKNKKPEVDPMLRERVSRVQSLVHT